MDKKKEIGRIIRSMRIANHMTQAELARKIHQSTSSITMYETGKREPDFVTLEAIADVFNVPLLLLGYDPERDESVPKSDETYIQVTDEDTRTLAMGFERMPPAERERLKSFLGDFFAKYFDEFDRKGQD